jgi:hypothetical protein
VFYSNDVGYLEIVYNVDLALTEIDVDLRRQRVESPSETERLGLLRTARLSDRPRPTFRTRRQDLPPRSTPESCSARARQTQ